MGDIKAIIVDDHTFVRLGLKQILTTKLAAYVEEADNGGVLLNKLQSSTYDIVILDISMPGRSGIDVLKDVKHLNPKLPVLILSAYSEDKYAVRALKAGASGYLTKDTAPENLVDAVQKILAGGKYITGKMAEKLIADLHAPAQDKLPHELLSDRELEVLCMIGEGQAVSEIADKLFLSSKTISTYRARILEKTGLKNNADIIKYVIAQDLLE